MRVKEEVRAQTDEPTAAHRREKERKGCGQERQIYKLVLLERLHACLVALELGEGSRSATLAQSLASLLDSIFEAVFCSRQTFWRRGMKKRFTGCRKGAESLQGYDGRLTMEEFRCCIRPARREDPTSIAGVKKPVVA